MLQKRDLTGRGATSLLWLSKFLFASCIPIFTPLIDDNSNPIAGSSENGNVVNDDITGYTNASVFQHLNSAITTPQQLREEVKTTLPSGVTSTDVDDLFGDYGY